ncbi:uncharacterized protein LOC127723675 isoform X2 [Mytilus californianus]|uniref:uncharacterized protein LOC127723675 isoform X2 n=1 Tax=Mytilus californianus TaxID=6549 RepID=UPI00224673AC|nr:uncharacterized protein LOC127723675 isoform X2 [Mytilus californianus]
MGTSFSVLCNNKRSVVVVSASVQNIKQEDVNDNIITSPRKLHPCESRDSGIENEIPHGLPGFSSVDGENNIIDEDADGDDESSDDDILPCEITKVSRPHSCRLGTRSSSRKKPDDIVLAEDKLVKILRNGKTGNNSSDENEQDIEREDSFYGDTKQNIKSELKFQDKRTKVSRLKSGKDTNGATVIGDLNSSSGESSDGEMWVIPDETIDQSRKSSQRKGWVSQDDALGDESESITLTSRSQNGLDYYRIVSDSYQRYDAHIMKKASEMSISSILLMPSDGLISPTNTELDEPINSLPFHLQRKMDDLVTMFMNSLRERRRKGRLTQSEYEGIMKNLRNQLVAFVFTCINNDSTPRIEVTSESKTLFSDNPWAVQINLHSSDEEILQTSEKQLAKRLVKKGVNISKEDIACLLGDHLRTIEQLQHVRDSGRLHTSETNQDTKQRLLSAPSSRKDNPNNNKRKKPPPTAHPKLNNNQKSKALSDTKPNLLNSAKNKKVNKPKGSLKGNAVCPVVLDSSDTESTIENSSDCDTPKAMIHSDSTDTKTYWIQPSTIDNQNQAADEAFTSLNAPMFTDQKSNQSKPYNSVLKKTNGTDSCTNSKVLKKSTSDVDLEKLQHANSPVKVSKLKKSISLDEQKLQCTLPPNLTNEEAVVATELCQVFWSRRQSQSVSEYCQLIKTAREDFILQYGHYFKELIKDTTSKGKQGGQEATPAEIELELKRLDHSFTKDILEKLDKNVVTEDILEKLIIIHMRKTSCVTVQTIKVAEAPLSRTHSLTDAIDPRQDGFINSAGSTISRKSEPDMRKWSKKDGLGSNNSDDIWGEVEKYQRAKSARSRVSTGKRRPGTIQVIGISPMEPLSEGMEDNNLTKVEETEGKFSVKSRPDSGIAVSMSSGSYSSYSSSDTAKEPRDDIDEACHSEIPDVLYDRVENVKPEAFNDIKSLVAGITKDLTSTETKAMALYQWLVRISFDKYTKTTKRISTPCAKLRQIVDKKLSYAQFYQDLCKAAGIKCEKVEGYVKNKDYLPGNTVQSSKFLHTWNAVSIDGQFRLVDPCFGARKEKYFIDHYFATSPDDLILSHFPKEKRWMLMNQSLSVEDFEGTVKTWPAMFHFNIRPLSMKSVIRTYDGKLSVTVLLRGVAVIPVLEYSGPGAELDADSLRDNIDEEIRDSDNAETFHITLPQEGNYYFTLTAHIMKENRDVPVFQHRIEYVDELL